MTKFHDTVSKRALLTIVGATVFLLGSYLFLWQDAKPPGKKSPAPSTPPPQATVRSTVVPGPAPRATSVTAASPASIPYPLPSSAPIAPQDTPARAVSQPTPVTSESATVAGITSDGIRLLPGGEDIARNLNSNTLAPADDLDILAEVLTTYRGIFGQNPPGGENAEITAALVGRNQKQLAILPPDSPALNSAGELIDRWGTPYFFHPVTRTTMEVLSAGPDRTLWTADDVGTLDPALVPNAQPPE